MNKDALLATCIGFAVGLIVTGLVIYGPGLVRNIPSIKLPQFSLRLPNFNTKSTPTPTASQETPKTHAVIIESPLPEALEEEETLLVSGTTSVSSTVIISGAIDDSIIQANGDGKWAGKVKLSEGKNTIIVSSLSPSNELAQESVSVYYTPESW